MATAIPTDVLQDDMAVSLAHVLAVANRRARETGVDIQQSLITITQVIAPKLLWQISYGPRDYIGRRGGDLMIEVDASSATIQRVLRGQ